MATKTIGLVITDAGLEIHFAHENAQGCHCLSCDAVRNLADAQLMMWAQSEDEELDGLLAIRH